MASCAMVSDVACVCVCATQYMVVYQCILAQASMAAFFVDGSSLDNLQVLLMPHQKNNKKKPSKFFYFIFSFFNRF